MKILICSDSHGVTEELQMIRERHINDCEMFIHCGDTEINPKSPCLKGYHIVLGNNDLANFPENLVLELDGKKILVTHGHRYNVYFDLMKLCYKGLEEEVDYIAYGHTHRYGVEYIEGITFINSGSVTFPRGHRICTYAILDTSDDSVVIYEVKTNNIIATYKKES